MASKHKQFKTGVDQAEKFTPENVITALGSKSPVGFRCGWQENGASYFRLNFRLVQGQYTGINFLRLWDVPYNDFTGYLGKIIVSDQPGLRYILDTTPCDFDDKEMYNVPVWKREIAKHIIEAIQLRPHTVRTTRIWAEHK